MIERLLTRLERRFGSLAIPGIIRYLAIGFAAVYLLGGFIPALGETLAFDRDAILAGEFWRPVTFLLTSSMGGGITPLGVVFCFFGMILMFVFSDGLEAQWGVFRTNLYVLWGWLSSLIAVVIVVMLTGQTPPTPGAYFGLSIFFAFATYNPRYTIMLFMIIPVPIWVLAAITGVLVSFDLLAGPLQAGFMLVCLSNYLVVAIPMLISRSVRKRAVAVRQKKYEANSLAEDEPFNRCVVCGATEITHPNTEFRVGKDGKDYCLEHLPESEK